MLSNQIEFSNPPQDIFGGSGRIATDASFVTDCRPCHAGRALLDSCLVSLNAVQFHSLALASSKGAHSLRQVDRIMLTKAPQRLCLPLVQTSFTVCENGS